MTIWVFGDSFVKHFPSQPDTWIEKVRKNLNEEIRSYTKGSATLEYVFLKFDEVKDQIQEKDIILIALPLNLRRWFFHDRPFSHFGIGDVSKKEILANEYYLKHLTHYNQIHGIYLTNFLYKLHHITEKKNLHTIVLPNFLDFEETIKKVQADLPLIYFPTGRIGRISDYEFDSKIVENSDVGWMLKTDPRLNHLIKSNHKILADKIVDNIKNKTAINLVSGMIQNVLDNRLLTDPSVFQDELFERKLS